MKKVYFMIVFAFAFFSLANANVMSVDDPLSRPFLTSFRYINNLYILYYHSSQCHIR